MPINWLTLSGSRSIDEAAAGCQIIPMPRTKVLPSQNVRPEMKQIFATSIAVNPQSE